VIGNLDLSQVAVVNLSKVDPKYGIIASTMYHFCHEQLGLFYGIMFCVRGTKPRIHVVCLV
jgi:hypothetical protein